MSYTMGPADGDDLRLPINVGAALNGLGKVSVGAWIKPSSWGANVGEFNGNTIIRINIADTPLAGVSIGFNQSGTPVIKMRPIGRSQQADAGQFAESTSDLQGWAGDGKWHHVGGVWDFGGAKIRAYIEGVAEANTGVTFGSATYVNTVTTVHDGIGGDGVGGSTKTFFGDIGEVAIWGDDIGDAGFRALWGRVRPQYVVPGSLLRWWRMFGKYRPALEVDYVAGAAFTLAGAAAAAPASHPPIFQWAFP